MYRLLKNYLLFLLACTVCSTLPAQMLPRYFHTQVPQAYVEYVDVPEILPTADGGYLVSYGYGSAGFHGILYGNELIKTDGSFQQEWRIQSGNHGGLGCASYADSTLLHFVSGSVTSLYKLRLNGQAIWQRTVSRGPYFPMDAVHVHTRGNKLIATGSLSEINGSGSLLDQSPMQMVLDTAGNILAIDSMAIAGRDLASLLAADDDGAGGTWLLGEAMDIPLTTVSKFIARLDSTGTVTFAQELSSSSSFSLDRISTLPSGGAIAAGTIQHPQSGIATRWLAKFATNGTLQWGATYGGIYRIHGIHELPNGGLLVLSMALVGPAGVPHPLLLRVDGMGNVVWAKRTVPGSGMGVPLLLGPNDWLFPVLGELPLLLETDSLFTNTGCNSTLDTIPMTPVSITLSPISLNVYPHSLVMVPATPLAVLPPDYVDSCAGVPTAVQPPTVQPSAVEQVTVYPNPSQGRVSVLARERMVHVEAWDALGRKVCSLAPQRNAVEVDLPLPGSYWLGVTLASGATLGRRVTVVR